MPNKKPIFVTIAVMTYSDNKRTVYGIFCGRLLHRNGQPYVNINKAAEVGKWEVGWNDPVKPTYLEMAKKFETWEALAFDFGRS